MFLGVLITTYQRLIGDKTPNRVLDPFKVAARATLGVFLISLISLVLDTIWPITGGGTSFYQATLVIFFVQLAAIAGIGAWTTLGVLLKG